MCNKGIGCLNHSLLHSYSTIDYQQNGDQAVRLMDSLCAAVHGSGSTPGSNDETPRVKFLCSFSGGIFPRPQDGKLRYVGGETRIVSVPRDVTYEELMSRMRELYGGAVVLKYQQPDEDLDALVSVVNDDDVTNMMEEYEKFGSGDGFTRLRIFLFSQPDLDGSSHYVDGDDRETERRYVDALNSMNDDNDFRTLHQPDSPVFGSVDDVHLAERFCNTISLEGGIHNQPQYNAYHLTVPHIGSGQPQPPASQRYNEMEGTWSPAYYSPRHYGNHDPKPVPEFPTSPSSARFRMPFGEERIPEEYTGQHVNHHPTYEHQPQFSENLVWTTSGTVGEKAGFPGNLLHGRNAFDGNGACEHCWLTFHRNQLHLEQPGNGIPQVTISCAECRPNRENLMLNAETNLPPCMYPKHQNETPPLYSEIHSHERGWVLQPQLNPRIEEVRTHISGTARLNDHYVVDGPSVNFPPGHSNLVDGRHTPPNLFQHRSGPEGGNQLFQDPSVAATPLLRIASPEERIVRYGNYPYGAENMYPMSHGHVPAQTMWRNVQNPINGAPSYEASGQLANGSINPAFLRGAAEGNLRLNIAVDNQNSWVPGFEGTASPPEYYYGHAPRLFPQSRNPENQCHDALQPSDSSSALIHGKLVSSSTPVCSPELRNNNVTEAVRMEENCNLQQGKEANCVKKVENSYFQGTPLPDQNMISEKSYEASSHLVNGSINPAFPGVAVDGNLRLSVSVDNQNSWVPGFEGTASPPEYCYSHAPRLYPQSCNPENQCADPLQPSDSSSALIDDKLVSSSTPVCSPELRNNNVTEAVRMEENRNLEQGKEANCLEKVENSDFQGTSLPDQNMISEKSIGSNGLQTAGESIDIVRPSENGPATADDSKLSVNRLSFLPELIASFKKAALEEAEEVKVKVEENSDSVKPDMKAKDTQANESELMNIHGELEADSDNENVNSSEIEPTKAEAEAIARGLQTIKNVDLEEIRELGSGTYGSVYHGKWKGSDVAIKRIKASCFAGRPSERERLIADFWKEALLLSSLHHPNVVSFYGIVRDGPDGSLATVTEFMVNGSLKQFLQKKDRTIDRRKRLIIAMDAAFGMEYLHGKNIVHFDLKCENLLVNMRDPQRPVCKIGDLGLSKVKQHTLVSGGVRGTLPWMAPELLSGKSHMVTEKIDVYSFGIVMWELLTGDEPYTDMHCASIIGGIVNNTLRPQIPSWCDPEWKTLMESCWASDPAYRPSFSEISQKLRSMAAAINVK